MLANGNDMTQCIEEYERFFRLFLQDYAKDDKIAYFNFTGFNSTNGASPLDQYYIPEYDESYNTTFFACVSTCDVPVDKFGNVCTLMALPGINTTSETNVSVEMVGLDLEQSNLIQLWSLSQDYLKFYNGVDFEWVK
jgi:hypothetical protein